jgi:hypothetical protein
MMQTQEKKQLSPEVEARKKTCAAAARELAVLGKRKLTDPELESMAWWMAYSNLGYGDVHDIVDSEIILKDNMFHGKYTIDLTDVKKIGYHFQSRLQGIAESDEMWKDFEAEQKSWRKDLKALNLLKIATTWTDLADVLLYFAKNAKRENVLGSFSSKAK